VSEPKRVLFVCVGNACRSQMAEAFARAYGSDVIIPASAGMAPAFNVASDTIHAMAEKGIDITDQFPKHVRHLERVKFDLVINMSGIPLDDHAFGEAREWLVPDPVCLSYEKHCEVRDRIERLVMELILELRNKQHTPGVRRFGSGQS
jgi:arsenate reductase (thioredoxin)